VTLFDARTFFAPKDFDHPHEYEDAFAVDAAAGVAAVADGAASGMLSGPWARLLAEATVAGPLDVAESGGLRAWLSEPRRQWQAVVAEANLNFFQRQKMKEWGGGAATLVWAVVTNGEEAVAEFDAPDWASSTEGSSAEGERPVAEDAAESESMFEESAGDELVEMERSADAPIVVESMDEEPRDVEVREDALSDDELPADAAVGEVITAVETALRARVFAIGDSCLFHVRGDELLASFPLSDTAAFERDPWTLSSIDYGRDEGLEFHALEFDCAPGDRLVLCSDALACWAVGESSQGRLPDWDTFWPLDEAAWHARVRELRDSGMRYDDTTLVLLRVRDPSEAGGGALEADGAGESADDAGCEVEEQADDERRGLDEIEAMDEESPGDVDDPDEEEGVEGIVSGCS
jgi:hypothetical protein